MEEGRCPPVTRRSGSDSLKTMLIVFVCVVVLAVVASMAGSAIVDYRKNAILARQQETETINREREAEYMATLAEFEQASSSGANLAWPAPRSEGWDVVDLTTYPLESPTTVTGDRISLMNNGMLLVNQWHSRPSDFQETALTSVGTYTGGKVRVSDYNKKLFPVAIDALAYAITDANALGYMDYMVSEAYRSYDDQNALFQKAMDSLKERYTGDALIAAASKTVNYPGTSEFNSGLSFTLRLYRKGDEAVNKKIYTTSEEGVWMSTNCWRYGLVFRFPLADFPLPGTQDKSYKTGISSKLRLYRYVGRGNAAAMNTLGLCLEEYVDYLIQHPHIAVFEDGQLKYEIYRQEVGDAESFSLSITSRASSYESSLDNMGGVVTTFVYEP